MNEKHLPVPLERLNDDMLAILKNEERKLYDKDPLIPAKNDAEAVDCWLSEYQASPNTHKAYKKEVERLILWALLMKKKGLSVLDRTDALEYEIFLENPTPESQWTGPRKLRTHPDWKPFSGPLGHAACKHALAAIKSLFNYLCAMNYLTANPFSMARKKISSPEERGGIEHYLNEELWQIILEYTDQLPQETRREAAEYNRLRYIMRLFYFTGGRITELASACMGDFYMRDNNWWLKIKGKCNRIERIPAHKEMVEALQVYRLSHGFADLPARNEKTPLIMALFQQRRVGVNMIYRIIKKHFQDIAAVIKTIHPNYAYTLQSATPHWIRHTAISHLTNKNVKAQHVQKFARHSNANSTAKYQHFEEVCWHKATQILGS